MLGDQRRPRNCRDAETEPDRHDTDDRPGGRAPEVGQQPQRNRLYAEQPAHHAQRIDPALQSSDRHPAGHRQQTDESSDRRCDRCRMAQLSQDGHEVNA
jgi:hypothetical protein